MPFGNEGVEETLGLALSGGGVRATLFHIVSLWRLGVLGKIDRISSISGGSICAGVLAQAWPRLEFAASVAATFSSTVVEPLREFCRRHVDAAAIVEGLLSPWTTSSERSKRLTQPISSAEPCKTSSIPRALFSARPIFRPEGAFASRSPIWVTTVLG